MCFHDVTFLPSRSSFSTTFLIVVMGAFHGLRVASVAQLWLWISRDMSSVR